MSFDMNDALLVDDITELKISDDSQIADIIQQRLSVGYQYTKVGDNMLIAIKSVSTSTPKSPIADSMIQEKNFAQRLRESLSAAVSMVNKILISMTDEDEKNQTILFLGDQISGKSETLIRMLAFFKTASLVVSTKKANVIGDLVIKSCQLMESFGHSRTTKYSSVSRIAKHIKIFHTNQHNNLELLSWTVDLIPFDRSRVHGAHPGRPQDIGNYHIFYQFVAAIGSVNLPLATKVKITSAKQFRILSPSFTKNPYEEDLEQPNDISSFNNLVQTFRILGFSDGDQNAIFTVAAIVLHLGNISITCNFNDERKERIRLTYPAESDKTMTLQEISLLLGISHNEFETILLKWPLADGQPLYAMFESTIITEIKTRIHKVMEFLYWQVVAWIILTLNQRFHENIMKVDDDDERDGESRRKKQNPVKYVSFIDFPGFEDNYPWNSLETLLINYANERLHLFSTNYLDQTIHEYESLQQSNTTSMSISMSNISFQGNNNSNNNNNNDNNNNNNNNNNTANSEALDLLVREKVGIFPILNKFSRVQPSTGDDVSMLLSQRHPKGVDILTSTIHRNINHGFRISHFNKKSICYDVDGFIEKNRVGHDCLRGLDTLLLSSTDAFIRRIAKIFSSEVPSPKSFSASATTSSTSIIMNPKQEKGKITTATEILSTQIDTLFNEISQNTTRFILCLDNRNYLHSTMLSDNSNNSIVLSSIQSSSPKARSISPNGKTMTTPPTSRPNSTRNTPMASSFKNSPMTSPKSRPNGKTSAIDFKVETTLLPPNDHLLAELRSYHVPQLLRLQRVKFPIILTHHEFYRKVEVFGRVKGWITSSGRLQPEILANRCSILLESLLPRGIYFFGKLSIMFTSTSYESIITEQLDELLYEEARVIQTGYRRYRIYKKYQMTIQAIIKLQSFFRKTLWKRLMLRVLAVRKERRMSALREQERLELQRQQELEEEELARQVQEQYSKLKVIENDLKTARKSPLTDKRKSENGKVSFDVEKRSTEGLSTNSDSLSSKTSTPKKLSPTNSDNILPNPPTATAISPNSTPARQTSTKYMTPPKVITPMINPMKLSPPGMVATSTTSVNGNNGDGSSGLMPLSKSVLTPRTAAWIETTPDDFSSESSPTTSSVGKGSNRNSRQLPLQFGSGRNSQGLGKPLNRYESFSPTLLNTGDDKITDPIILAKRLNAYNILTTNLLAVWRNYSLAITMEKLHDAIIRRKSHLMTDILQMISRRRIEEAESLPYVKDKKQNYRNLYHIATSVSSIDCVNGLGVTMLDIVVRDRDQNNWLHIMTESPNIDFVRRLHGFIQRYDQVIRLAQPVRTIYSAILSIIAVPTTLCSGWLFKLSTSDKFQKRYIVLTSNKLVYYSNDTQVDPKNASDTLLVSVDQTIIRHNRDVEFSFVLDSIADIKSTKGKKRFIFKASSREEYFEWLKALSQVTTVVTTRDPNVTTSSTPVNIVNPKITNLWVTEVNTVGDTPLHKLARLGVVKQDQTIHSLSSATAAAEFEDCYHIISIAAWLIDNGCPMDTPNLEGYTPFDLALQSQSFDLASYLLRLGARTFHIQDSDVKELESRDCFKGQVYRGTEALPLPPPEKWYNFTYFSMNIQEIHLKSSNGRSNNNMSASFVRRNDDSEEEYFVKALACPYLQFSAKDNKGKLVEPIQTLRICGYRGLGILVWGQTFHLQSPLQAMENKIQLELTLMNYNPVSKLSAEIAKGIFEIDFSTINSGPTSIFLERFIPSRPASVKYQSKRKYEKGS